MARTAPYLSSVGWTQRTLVKTLAELQHTLVHDGKFLVASWDPTSDGGHGRVVHLLSEVTELSISAGGSVSPSSIAMPRGAYRRTLPDCRIVEVASEVASLARGCRMTEPGAGANSSRCRRPAALSGRENFPYSFKAGFAGGPSSPSSLRSSLRCGPRGDGGDGPMWVGLISHCIVDLYLCSGSACPWGVRRSGRISKLASETASEEECVVDCSTGG